MSVSTPASISAHEFSGLLSNPTPPCVVDVRTPAEFSACHVRGARLAPLDALDPHAVVKALKPAPETPIYLLCKGGARAAKAADQFRAAGIQNVCVVTGGTDACVAANVPVDRGAAASIPLDGQVRIAIGGMIILFCLLARFGHPGFAYLLPLMAAALIISGVTGFCGMAILLGKAPWNQSRDAESCRVC